jgi:hypothetical protein
MVYARCGSRQFTHPPYSPLSVRADHPRCAFWSPGPNPREEPRRPWGIEIANSVEKGRTRQHGPRIVGASDATAPLGPPGAKQTDYRGVPHDGGGKRCGKTARKDPKRFSIPHHRSIAARAADAGPRLVRCSDPTANSTPIGKYVDGNLRLHDGPPFVRCMGLVISLLRHAVVSLILDRNVVTGFDESYEAEDFG